MSSQLLKKQIKALGKMLKYVKPLTTKYTKVSAESWAVVFADNILLRQT